MPIEGFIVSANNTFIYFDVELSITDLCNVTNGEMNSLKWDDFALTQRMRT